MQIRVILLILIAGWFPAFHRAFRLYDGKEGAGKPVCFDRHRSLEELERYANAIVTGTVEKTAPSPNDYNFHMAVVRVRRVFKLNSNKDTSVEMMVNNGANGRIVILNVGDPTVCRSEVKEKDTKIFFLSSAYDKAANFYDSSNAPSSMEFATLPQYMLNSSVIPLTLRNLDTVEAAVRGWPAKTRKPLKPEACERTLCAFGAVCRMNATTGRPYCDCSFNCDNVFSPVCGSDNVTYKSECWLNRSACKQQRRIRVKLPNACDAKNPCDSMKCQYGAKCQVSEDGKTARCVCPDKCYRYGDSHGSKPVCGDDGRTYESECHLQLESCRTSKEISIRYTGLCDPCANVTCPDSMVCKLNPMREPVCRCSEQCPLDYKPVCASDGRTYQNPCIMRIQECKLSRELRIVYNSACEKGKNPCHGLRCDYGQECFIDPFGRATCECLHRCEPVVRPVCGKDGITYDSECELLKTACHKKIRNAVEHKGACGVGACAEHACTIPGTVCVLRQGKPVCQCPSCNEDFDPVCGSDGITYGNECKMRLEGCEKKRNIFVKYRGFCNGCKNKRCDNYGICVADDQGQATCKCPSIEDCPTVRDQVCGIDGRTYENECYLKVAACQKNEFILPNSKGPCDACSGVKCLWGSRCENGHCVCPEQCPVAKEGDEVCGSDGLLYPSECLMQVRACAKGMKMTVIERDRCSDEIVNVDQVGGTCECNRIGSKSSECDSAGQCPCKPGVSGRKCDQCLPGFWGLHLIAKGNAGCIPCACSAFGSDREDCHQDTGRCVCKPGVKTSMKCDECEDGLVLRPQGCVPLTDMEQPTSCDDMKCYYGAKCQVQAGRPECLCPDFCSLPTSTYGTSLANMEVCGSNGVSYGSPCQLKQFACRLQSDVVVVSLGPCSGTDQKIWKAVKTTRDLVTSDSVNEDEQLLTTFSPQTTVAAVEEDDGNVVVISKHEFPGKSTVLESPTKSEPLWEKDVHVGDVCSVDDECAPLEYSLCVQHLGRKVCLCQRGFVPSQNRSQCVAVTNQIEPCAQQPYPCQNGGSCVDDQTQPLFGFRCICPRGFAGLQCEKNAEKSYLYSVPRFGGHSWMEFNRMDAYSDVTIDMQILPHDTQGLILYNGQNEDEKGDFISLALVNGFVEFRYNLGDGITILKSREKVKTDKWHKIVASRIGRHGHLTVDNSEPVTTATLQISPRSNAHLNLRRSMFIGKVPHTPRYVVRTVGTSHAFSGCILSLKINGKIYDLRQSVSVDVVKAHNVGECGVNPCSSLPCLNGGTCVQKSDTDFVCVCDALFTGNACETPADSCASQPCKYGGTCQPVPSHSMPFSCICPQGRTGVYCENFLPEPHDTWPIPELHGTGYLELRPLPSEAERTLSIVLWLMPYKPDGLLFFSGGFNDMHGYTGGDFIAAALVNSKVQFLFNLGSGMANITSRKHLEMGKWHSIKVYRHLRNGSLQIDQDDIEWGMAPPPWDKLNLDGLPLFIGGTRNSRLLKSLVGVETGFYGAIQRISVNDVPIENLVQAAIFTSGMGRYNGPPCTPNPCRNGGTCLAKLDKFTCMCGFGFIGRHCEQESAQSDIDEEGPVNFDGRTFLRYRNRIHQTLEGQQESSFVFRLRTNASEGLIIWENRGMTLRGDYLGIGLSGGHVTVTFNLGKETAPLELRSDAPVNDTEWHVVRFWRTKRQAYLAVDEEDSPTILISSPGATELNTDGYVWIGGSSRLPTGLPRHYYAGYVGCLDAVSIDSQHLHLARHQVKPSWRRLIPCQWE